jgi:hypothetical protein
MLDGGVVCHESFWVVVCVDGAGELQAEFGRREPFGVPVGQLAGEPALAQQLVMHPAGEGQFVDVGAPTDHPFVDMVDFAEIARLVAAREGTSTVQGVQNNSLIG